MRGRTGGFTLLEAVIAMAVLATIIVSVFAIAAGAGEAYREGVSQAQVEGQDRRIVDLIANELAEARVTQVASDGCVLELQIPVEVGGSFYGAANQLNWGAQGNSGWTVRYSMVSHADPEVLDETSDRADYNGDNLIQDDFERVFLRRSILDALGNEVDGANLTRMALVPYPPDLTTGLRPVLNMDADDAAMLDPPFQRISSSGVPSATGSQVRIALWIQRTRDDGNRFVFGLTTKAFTRNMPE